MWLHLGVLPHLPNLAAKSAGVGTKDEEQPHPGTSAGDNDGAGGLGGWGVGGFQLSTRSSVSRHPWFLVIPLKLDMNAGKSTSYY